MNLAHVMNVVAVRVTQTGKDTEAGVITHLAELLTMDIMYVVLLNKHLTSSVCMAQSVFKNLK